MGYEEDEEGTIHLIVSNPIPIAFQATKKTTIFVNGDLWSLHIPLPSTRETRYKITISPIGRGLAIEGEIMKKAKRVKQLRTHLRQDLLKLSNRRPPRYHHLPRQQ
jgi:hypothetical protein